MNQTLDLLFLGGTVVTGEGARRLDVGVRQGRVVAVEADLSGRAAEKEIDISARLLLPGVIDVHVHPVYADDMKATSCVAAYGGTTTLIHFAYARQGQSLEAAIQSFLEEGRAGSRLDFGLHGGLFDAERLVPEIPKAMELGIRSFKFFLTYVKQGWYTDDYNLMKAMDILAANGGLAMVHAENGGGIDYLEDKYLRGPLDSAKHFNDTRPPALEEEGIFRSIRFAEVSGCPLYIPHVSSAQTLRPLAQARAEGLTIYGEATPHHLMLTKALIETRGALAKVGPPLRADEDRLALWSALSNNLLQVAASDHAAKNKDPQSDFIEQGFGSPQAETLLPITHDEGVNKGRISLVRLVKTLTENPARIFGLYPQKGTIAVGSDADPVVFDPNRSFTINAVNQHSNVGYTLYEGRTVLGWPERSYQRGRLVLADGEILGQLGEGCFLKIAPPGTPL